MVLKKQDDYEDDGDLPYTQATRSYHEHKRVTQNLDGWIELAIPLERNEDGTYKNTISREHSQWLSQHMVSGTPDFSPHDHITYLCVLNTDVLPDGITLIEQKKKRKGIVMPEKGRDY